MSNCANIQMADVAALSHAANLIEQGGVVAFPTDTVYGLAADLFNAAAVERIYEIKGRPANMPLIAMIAEVEQWPQVAASLTGRAQEWMRRFWPGPLTLIVPARADMPARVLGGGRTIGMRIPDHESARHLLRLANRPLATTSANLSGHPSACTAAEVASQLGNTVDLILDAGTCPGGLASTVLDCTTDPPRLLREGPITAAMLGI